MHLRQNATSSESEYASIKPDTFDVPGKTSKAKGAAEAREKKKQRQIVKDRVEETLSKRGCGKK